MPQHGPHAAFATHPGSLAHGLSGVRESLTVFTAMKGTLDLKVITVLEASGLALVVGVWSFAGTGPDGKPVKLTGTTPTFCVVNQMARLHGRGGARVMTAACVTPIADETMVDYWSGGLPPQQSEAIEEHVFSCAACAARLEAVASMAAAITSLARQGRFSGIISRATLNQLQRDGVRVRVYSLLPGDVVPCAAFPDDDLVVTSMRGDFAGVDAVTLSVTGSTPMSGVVDDVPVSAAEGELLWATPGSLIRQMPTSRVTLTVTAGRANGRRIGEYVLDHTAP